MIGDAPKIGQPPFSQGYSLAAVIANEFGEATGTPYLGAVRGRAGAVRPHSDREHHRAAGSSPAAARQARHGRDWHGVRRAGRRRLSAALGLPQISARRRRTDKVMRARCWPLARCVALSRSSWSSTTCSTRGSSAWSRSVLHHRSQRQLLRQPRRYPQRDPRHDRDRRARDTDLGPDRDRRGAVPDRVRQGLAIRQRRALLRRRDDRRPLDRVRPVHLHRARRSATSAGAGSPPGRGRSRSRC